MIADGPTNVVLTMQQPAGLLDELDAAAARPLRSVIRAGTTRKMTGDFSTPAHIMAPARLATPGPSMQMQIAALPVNQDTASAMNPADSS